jgi:hypothetical protein
MSSQRGTEPKALEMVCVELPPAEQRRARDARFVQSGEKANRYTLPARLESSSPVGYRTRVSLTREEGDEALQLLSLTPPSAFAAPTIPTEGELFEETSLGLLIARQSTNYRGQRQITLGPRESSDILPLLHELTGSDAPPGERPLEGASHTHVYLSRPYRTPFTLLLTFVGHPPLLSLASVPARALAKRFRGAVDIPTIGYLQQMHLGILADTVERGVVIASEGRRRAQLLAEPFVIDPARKDAKAHAARIRQLETKIGLTGAERRAGWRISLVAQVGVAIEDERVEFSPGVCRKLAANILSFRSERIQPGVNQEKKAPPQYHQRQDMDVSEAFTFQAGRAAYNAFARWTGLSREAAKELLILDRIDVMSPNGKERLRSLRAKLGRITDKVVRSLPKWVDLPTGKAFSRNAERGRKAFALAGQRIYLSGLSPAEVAEAGLSWNAALRAAGAAAARGALYSELMGVIEVPDDCDLLAGICLMAGPVNQDDIGRTHFGMPDLLAEQHGHRDPRSLLVWTLKAKTVADPIGNEEQLLNAARKGALVDLRPGPHEVVDLRIDGRRIPMRAQGNKERAYADVGNFVRDHEGYDIPGNPGEAWPERDTLPWSEPSS